MRGTPRFRRAVLRSSRIIPAYAGNTSYRLKYHVAFWDHPRVCGEHFVLCGPWCFVLGSSPRMRGTRHLDRGRRRRAGIIPAYAGNTHTLPFSPSCHRDHPRVCGEHAFLTRAFVVTSGSSPRMRGTRSTNTCRNSTAGIIPAYAGNTPCPRARSPQTRDHPRVCGEHDVEGPLDLAGIGIIPAYAGNTSAAT